MRDVSVRVGGLNGAAIPGAYASAFNHSGEINSEGGQMVMVENYSQLPFQIGRELVPAMYRKTFGIDNYPKLQWTVTGQVGNPAFFVGLSETRTVRIIVDPVITQSDGPVYPEESLTCFGGFLNIADSLAGAFPTVGQSTNEFMIDAYSLINGFKYEVGGTGRGGGGSTVLPAAVLDPAIVKFEFYMPKELQTIASIDGSVNDPPGLYYASVPPAVYLALGAGKTPLTKFFDAGVDFPNSVMAAGRDLTVRTRVPGASLIVIRFGLQPPSTPSFLWRAWVGWHL